MWITKHSNAGMGVRWWARLVLATALARAQPRRPVQATPAGYGRRAPRPGVCDNRRSVPPVGQPEHEGFKPVSKEPDPMHLGMRTLERHRAGPIAAASSPVRTKVRNP
jgi:hypothetical protein